MTVAPKILVADDDQALSRTLSWILKENGYDVFTAPGGEHLFEHLTAEQFDLLLLDIMMPKVDGLQLLQRVKADPRFKDLPVLMISSMPPEEATVRSLGLGVSGTRRLVDEFTIESDVGKGTTVTVRLPYRQNPTLAAAE